MNLSVQIKSLLIILSLIVFVSGQKQIKPRKCLDTGSLTDNDSKFKVSELESNVFLEINKLRKDPNSIVSNINDLKKFLDGKILRVPGQIAFRMNEGEESFNSAISDLQKISALSPLILSEGLSKVAKGHLKDVQQNPDLGHTGKDGSTLKTRLLRFGKIEKFASENINYTDKDPRQIVLRMIIDDGVPSRTHRKNLLSTDFKQIGISCGNSNKSQMICVFVFADNFTENKNAKKKPVSY